MISLLKHSCVPLVASGRAERPSVSNRRQTERHPSSLGDGRGAKEEDDSQCRARLNICADADAGRSSSTGPMSFSHRSTSGRFASRRTEGAARAMISSLNHCRVASEEDASQGLARRPAGESQLVRNITPPSGTPCPVPSSHTCYPVHSENPVS